ncbi:DnaJ-like subfamily C member 7-like [Hondaea fermentalgiana]|uniref:DnaJ-like subfamily C member 7-like n=1 Tax=Hondaea fermentalgiana TaxID=2315210 RepID=A0A2R5GFV4_9STRA|nr:DnaJ-like subfamily C member 7-like [Hondaea fermentalgiana]|eukprot:GBG29455.1 DnaJ-like subfamily C member 7-like [Hondaea fermentalgiana]
MATSARKRKARSEGAPSATRGSRQPRPAAGSRVQLDALASEIVPFVGTPRDWAACRTINSAWREAADRVGMRNCWIELYKSATPFLERVVASPRFAESVHFLDLTQLKTKLIWRDYERLLGSLPNLRGAKVRRPPRGSAGLKLLLAQEQLETLEFLDLEHVIFPQTLRTIGSPLKLKSLRLYFASGLEDKFAQRMADLSSVKDLLVVGACWLTNCMGIHALPDPPPPLVRLTLVDCGRHQMSAPHLVDTLRRVAPTIEYVNLTDSLQTFPTILDWYAPRLRSFVLDGIALSDGFQRMLFEDVLPALQLLSAARCPHTDEYFTATQGQSSDTRGLIFGPSLRVVDLSSTRIGVNTLSRFEACPSFRLAMVDSCRNLPRKVRTKYAALRNAPGMEALHTDLKSVQDDAETNKRKAAVEAWRKKVQFALYNTEYRRCGELCDDMLKKMSSESLEWRIPVLVQRAETYLKWSEVAETERIRRSRIRCAKMDCAAALEEVGGHRSHLLADTLLGLGLTMQSQVDLLHGHLGNARRKLAKAIEGMRKHPELLVLWGLDYVSVASVKLQEVSKAGTLQSQAEEALKQNKPLRCLRHIDSLLAVCPVSVQGLSLKVDALLKAKRWADAATFCEKVKGELDAKTDRRLLANMIMGEARCAYAHGKVDEAVHLAQSIDDIFMQGESRVSLTLWRRLSEDKAKGNAFFAKGQYSKALDHYSAALARCTSPKFSAILHSNRAATHMARKQYKLALNDCDEALRLDPNYTKAMLRRARAGAQLHDELSFLLRARADYHRVFRRDHTQKATHQQELNELELRISSLQKAEADARAARQKNARPRPGEKTPERSKPSSASTWGGGSFGSANVTAWLDSKGRIKNYYQALGLTQGAGIDRVSIKKAFHRLALKHHPDKTQAAPEMERRKSETTFKRVAEAYSVLGNDEVREQYDRFFRCVA